MLTICRLQPIVDDDTCMSTYQYSLIRACFSDIINQIWLFGYLKNIHMFFSLLYSSLSSKHLSLFHIVKESPYEKKNVFPSASRRVERIFSSNSGPGSYSRHKLAGKMCLFRSYHRLSTTFVNVASLSAPSNWSFSGRDIGLSVEAAGGGLFE